MSNFDFDMDDLFSHLNVKEKQTLNAQREGMIDTTDDLARISSEIAPIKGSDLRKSVDKTVTVKPEGVIGDVTFNVTEASKSGSRFNYALWTHEMDYQLGEQSQAAPGTDGYHVGNKYLERPLKGEAEKYVNWWAKQVLEVLDG